MREYQCGFGVLRWDEVNDSRWRLRMNLNAHASPVKIVADGRARSVDFGSRNEEERRPAANRYAEPLSERGKETASVNF